MSLLIKNGTIITATDTYQADLLIEGKKVKTIGQDLESEGAEIIDASGKYILPGAIDVHTHLEMPFGGTVSADSYEAGTRAAACGGVTTVFDFAIQNEGQGLLETINGRDKLCAPQACVDYAFHVAITDLRAEVLEELAVAVDYGVPSFKAFMAYKKSGLMINDAVLADLLEKSKEVGALIGVHAENADLVESRTEKFLAEDKTSAWYHYLSRPEFVEVEATKRAIHLAKSLDAPLYIVHLASAEGMAEVTKARDEGYEIYAETCPQYLYFTKDVYKRENGRNFVCSPPIKGQESQDALWDGIKRSDISVVATDHCPFQSEEKDWGKNDFSKIPNGCMGVENLYPYMLSEANKGRISFNKVVELCATNPAQIFGCAPAKGSIAPGADADLVIYDPQQEFTITQDKMHSDVDHTIWEGLKLEGYPIMTFSRGRLVFKKGKFLGEAGWGKFIKRSLRK
ncbi:dihydropyrimidinase [Orenia metallireducens]|uniref:Dihydropyrimidinase n=1 Tax=Orenia metallireducens TaxID=1413210 RepID=A0A285I037_9FIRM|nr:dihydropyrimidinase [Orenia metallireducens]SNY41324.1 dihydropyrimidinase [Orenia metallireducens]